MRKEKWERRNEKGEMRNHLFELMQFSMYSFNSLFQKSFDNVSDLMNLFFNDFASASLLLFNWITFALLVLLFFDVCIFLLFLSNIVNEIFELFVSNSIGIVLLKLYLSSFGFSFDILSGWKEMS